MEISEEPTFPGFEDGLRSCPQAYPASQPPLPGSAEAAKMTAGSGRQCSMLLDSLSPLGAFSKILLESSLWTNSEEYCYVWNRLDTKFALSAFQLTPLGLSTDDNGCSLWQTPVADDAMERENGKINSRGEPKLSAQVMLWPTPTAMTNTGGQAMCKWGGAGAREQLRKMVTPEELNGSLNPQWVEWLMGFPIDHTALKRSATRSSRSRSTRSSGPSH
jgi:hypothetical protein